jgi:hypothetical protein
LAKKDRSAQDTPSRKGAIIVANRSTPIRATPSEIAWNHNFTREERALILSKLQAIDSARHAVDQDPAIMDRIDETRQCLRLLRISSAVK